MKWEKLNSITYYAETKYFKLFLRIDSIDGKVDASLICKYIKIPDTGLGHFGDPYGLRGLAKNEHKIFTSFCKAKCWAEQRAIKKEKKIVNKTQKHYNMYINKVNEVNIKQRNRERVAKNRLNKIYNEVENMTRQV